MEDVLASVRALIALATSPTASENEARTAAMAACKYIKNKSILLILPPTNIGSTFPAPAIPVTPKSRAVPPGWKKIKAKYEGVCRKCEKPIVKDANIMWSKTLGAYHVACFTTKNV